MPRTSWFLYSSLLGDTYQLDVGYRDSRGNCGALTKNSNSKVPWGPPVSCEFNVKRGINDTVVKEFRFLNSNHEEVALDTVIFNSLKEQVNPFTQKVSSLCTRQSYKLLACYLTAVQSSEGFYNHKEGIHTTCGFPINGEGVQLDNIEHLGGTKESLMEFISLVKQSANNGIGSGFKSSHKNKKKT